MIAARYAAINSTKATWSDQYRFRLGDGRYADVLDRGYVLRNQEGLALRAVGGPDRSHRTVAPTSGGGRSL